MARIAILGATSTIAKDLIVSFAAAQAHELFLYARRPHAVDEWLAMLGITGAVQSLDIQDFGRTPVDLVINCIGVGDPRRAVELGAKIVEITRQTDEMVLDYLRRTPNCRYLFLSSGAVYGGPFEQPVSEDNLANIPINALKPHHYYGLSKLIAESVHRLNSDLPIIDLRIFNYFSRHQDLSSRFLASDLVRCLRNGETAMVSPERMVRDFIHPSDFFQAVCRLLTAEETNDAVDCYSAAPIDKVTLLQGFSDRYGLKYQFSQADGLAPNATGSKPCYYSVNYRLSHFGYQPCLTSQEALYTEIDAILGC